MKKSTNKWIVIAAAFIMIGILGFLYVMAMIRGDFSSLWKAKYETNTVEIKEDFRDFSINTDMEDIIFMPSEDGKCKVVLYEQKKIKHTASVRDGILSIIGNDTRKWFDRISMFFGIPKITVYLPQTEYGSLVINEDTGDIVIPGSFMFENINISASTGNIDCNASSEGKIKLKTSTGSIRVEDIAAGELDLSVSTGKIEMSSVDSQGDVKAIVSTGKTIMKDVSCKNIISSGSTGNITLENLIAEETISITRSTGDVKFVQCDAGELFITTNTGDVTGSLLSEKVFITQSDTGRIDVPETTTGGKCIITTGTGKISITVK